MTHGQRKDGGAVDRDADRPAEMAEFGYSTSAFRRMLRGFLRQET
jgi:hypothetical protein